MIPNLKKEKNGGKGRGGKEGKNSYVAHFFVIFVLVGCIFSSPEVLLDLKLI